MFLSRLRKFWSPGFSAPLRPEEPVVVIGDIHGRADLLDRLLGQLWQAHKTCRLVFVGDYIDRGEDSAKVLARLHGLERGDWPGGIVCLKGNHEAMLLDFLVDPVSAGPGWIRHGGALTLASFGIQPVAHNASPGAWREVRDTMQNALGPAREAWLRDLPLSWHSGNVFVSHAGADPARPVTAQREDVLLWGHRAFRRRVRRDGVWVVHGHTIRNEVTPRNGRLGLDTGAYATGKLSAALLVPGDLRIVST